MSGKDQEHFQIVQEFEERKKLSKDEIINRMDDWASSGRYDKQMVTSSYIGPRVVSEAVGDYFTVNRDRIRIVDIAAGTGAVALELKKLGFKNIDAIDPSKEMLKVAESKNIYQNYYNEFMDGRRLNIIKTDTFDCAVICGGFSQGYMPTNAIFEIIRMTKLGGIIAFTIPKFYEFEVAEFKGRLIPLFERFEQEGVWQVLKKDSIPALLDDIEAWRFVFKVLVSESKIPQLPTINGGISNGVQHTS